MAERPSTAAKRREAIESVPEEDRLWLAERLIEYKDLLEFLHSN